LATQKEKKKPKQAQAQHTQQVAATYTTVPATYTTGAI
jgi:hypothetical protein